MMDLLIEILSEEIPARMQKKAEETGGGLFDTLLQTYHMNADKTACYVSPRRVSLLAFGCTESKGAMADKRGPRVDAAPQALQGFLKANGLDPLIYGTPEAVKDESSPLFIKGDYYYLTLTPKPLEDSLPLLIHDFIGQCQWPKSMIWDHSGVSWVRPIRQITCFMDDRFIPINLYNIPSRPETLGHRFLSDRPMTLHGVKTYESQLADNHVTVSFDKRRNQVLRALQTAATAQGLVVKEDQTLVDEVTGLVDTPFAYVGTIDPQFMTLPPVVLSTSMRVHQKYFTLQNDKSATTPAENTPLANKFGVISNTPLEGERSDVINGYERVLRARLSDATFFFDSDINTPLETWQHKFQTRIFHEKLGTLQDKIDRLLWMADKFYEDKVSWGSVEQAPLKRAIGLCKCDLFTKMVQEFPELQGIMGHIYALKQGEGGDVAHALEYHYQPLGPSRDVPDRPLSRALALLDKIDTLVGFLGHNIKPTGTKDPLAMRRTALGILRLSEVHFVTPDGWKALISAAIDAYHHQGRPLLTTCEGDVHTFIQARQK